MVKAKKKGEKNPCKGIPKSFHRHIQKKKDWEGKRDPSLPFDGYNVFMQKHIIPTWRAQTDGERRKWFSKVCRDAGSNGVLKPRKGSKKTKKTTKKTKRKSVMETSIPRGNAGRGWFKNHCGDLAYDALKEKKKTYANRSFAEENCPDKDMIKDFDKYMKSRNKRFRKGLKYVKAGGCGCELCRNKLGGCACSKGWGECSNYLPSW